MANDSTDLKELFDETARLIKGSSGSRQDGRFAVERRGDQLTVSINPKAASAARPVTKKQES